jgi:hypothetical protein
LRSAVRAYTSILRPQSQARRAAADRQKMYVRNATAVMRTSAGRVSKQVTAVCGEFLFERAPFCDCFLRTL